ncbi:MAG: hypothetical protein ABSC55_17380 [Syntrophorhabdales bacterium]|jgi:phenylacetate-coenzyme A ligase PaaK-like adenylate-forming protein
MTHGVEREDIRSLDDLTKLPFAEKDELRQVPEGTLPRYEMKAKLIRKLYEEK